MPERRDPATTYAHHLASQPSALAELVARSEEAVAGLRALPDRPWSRVVFVGSGTSRFAGEVAAPVWRGLLGVDAWVVPTLPFEEASDGSRLDERTLVVAISQSGGTHGLVRGVARARAAGSATVAVTSDPASPLALAAEVTVDAFTGPEDVYAKTKGFVTTALAACLAGHALARLRGTIAPPAGDAFAATLATLPDQAERVLRDAMVAALPWAGRLASCRTLAVVGSGRLRPAAAEGALKILEVAKLPVLDFELEESLHGPFNAFGHTTGLVLLAAADASPARTRAFVAAARHVGAPLLVLAEAPTSAPQGATNVARAEAPADARPATPDLAFPMPTFAALAPLLAVLPLQVLALHLARARGVDPDRTRYPELYAIFRTKAGQGEEEGPDRDHG